MLGLLRRLLLALLTIGLAPLLALVGLALLVVEALHRIWPRRAPAAAPALAEVGRDRLASVVILNWNGKDLLAQGLPSVLEAVRADRRPHEVLVVDNGSTDGSADYVRATFPDVRILALDRNLGFVAGNNAGVREARHDTVVLLNNDMAVDRGFLRPLLDAFGHDTFAVASQVYLQDPAARREETGKTSASFRRGWIDFTHVDLEGRTFERAAYPTLWAGGGSAAFDRSKYLALGGLDTLYAPMYVEDTDLSYRAWKAGWEVLFAPRSVVYHKHRASSSRRFTPTELAALILRNQLLFLWRNVDDGRLLASHALLLPWNAYRIARDSGIGTWRGIAAAAARLPRAAARKLASPGPLRSDRAIFELAETPALHFAARRRPASQQLRILWITAYLPHLGRHAGAGRMFQLLRRLAAQHRITLLTFLENDAEREFVAQVEPVCETVVALRRTPPPRLQLFPYEPFDEFRTPEMLRAVRECLEERDFDLIQLEYSQMACYADRRLGIPYLLTKHEVDFAACLRQARVASAPGAKLAWFYRYLQVLEREIALARRVDGIVCMTEPDAGELRKFHASVPIHVVQTGVDLDYFRPPARPAAEPRLVFVGAFQHHPNVDAMIHFCREILPRIRAAIPEVELLIVGSNPPDSVRALGEIPGVTVTGYVPDVRPHMASSSVYVVPLRLGVGIRGKILEAWGMGMAVVATSVACSGLRWQQGSNILVADDAELFAAHVVSLVRDPERRARLGAEGRRTVEQHYGWDASARELDTLCRRYAGAPLEAPVESVASGDRLRR